MARATDLPGLTIGTVPVFYMGREIKVPGNPSYQDWSITILNDEDFSIRKTFERWQAALNGHNSNVRNSNMINSALYSTTGSVIQYSKAGSGQIPGGRPGGGRTAGDTTGATGLRKYNMIGVWPIDVSPISLDWGANDAIEEFTVTLAVQWWEVEREGDPGLSSKTVVG